MIITYKGQQPRTTKKMTREEVLASIPSGRHWVRPRELSIWLGLDVNSLGHQLSEMGFGRAKIKMNAKVQERVWYIGTTPVEEWDYTEVRKELRVNPA